jgi:hypothetical protein
MSTKQGYLVFSKRWKRKGFHQGWISRNFEAFRIITELEWVIIGLGWNSW